MRHSTYPHSRHSVIEELDEDDEEAQDVKVQLDVELAEEVDDSEVSLSEVAEVV